MKHTQEHYQQHDIEPIDVIEEYELGFHLGNALKYILRAEYKGTKVEDLEKARWYIDRALALATQEENDKERRGNCLDLHCKEKYEDKRSHIMEPLSVNESGLRDPYADRWVEVEDGPDGDGLIL